eukprot:1797384-Alexandrium_andersonii.AAC.1
MEHASTDVGVAYLLGKCKTGSDGARLALRWTAGSPSVLPATRIIVIRGAPRGPQERDPRRLSGRHGRCADGH